MKKERNQMSEVIKTAGEFFKWYALNLGKLDTTIHRVIDAMPHSEVRRLKCACKIAATVERNYHPLTDPSTLKQEDTHDD
jgi:hypothetical protein